MVIVRYYGSFLEGNMSYLKRDHFKTESKFQLPSIILGASGQFYKLGPEPIVMYKWI